jgi:ABC-type uncharacterized transport system substrate-binding protein
MKLLMLKCLTLFILNMLSYDCFAYNQDQRRVLVLNSYHHGYTWTDNILHAIEKKFKDNPNVILNIEYMDTKMINNPDHFEQLRQLYKNKYAQYKIDVIISTDDDALKFLRKYRDELFPGVPVVFCGVNNFTETKVADFNNYTGVSEESDFTSNFELILKLHPDVKRLYVINDGLTTARSLQTEFFEALKEYEDKFDFELLSDYTLQDLINKISSVEADSIVIYLSFFSDSTGRAYAPVEVIPYISKASPVPVYGSVDYMMGYGIVGGALGSSSFQGGTAADQAQKILEGYSVEKIPVVLDNPSIYMFDYNILQRFGIKLSSLPKDSTIINEPESFYGKYQDTILAALQSLREYYLYIIFVVVGSFVLMIVYTFLLVINISKRRRMQKGLQEIAAISPEFPDASSVDAFRDGLLVVLRQILPIKNVITVKVDSSGSFDETALIHVQGSGEYESMKMENDQFSLPKNPLRMIRDAFAKKKNILEKNSSVIFLNGDSIPITMIYVEAERNLNDVDCNLLKLFSDKVCKELSATERQIQKNMLLTVQKGLQEIAAISPALFDTSSADRFRENLLTTLAKILPTENVITLKVNSSSCLDKNTVVDLQGSGKYKSMDVGDNQFHLPDVPLEMIKDSFARKKSIVRNNNGVVFFKNDSLPIIMIFVEADRNLDAIDCHLLELFSEKVLMILDRIEKNKIEESLDTARQIQMSMLPTNFVEFTYKNPVDLRAFISPVKKLGGDLYDFFVKNKNQIVFTVGDVAGMGVPAALFMTAVKTLIRSNVKQYTKPGDVLYNVNNVLYQHQHQEYAMFVTLFLAILDLDKGELYYANAGHNPPYLVDSTGAIQRIAVNKGVALGNFEDVEFANEQMTFGKDQGMLLYSDGIVNALDTDANKYGDQRLKSSLAKVSTQTADDIIEHLLDDLALFTTDAAQSDDITLLFIRNHNK